MRVRCSPTFGGYLWIGFMVIALRQAGGQTVASVTDGPPSHPTALERAWVRSPGEAGAVPPHSAPAELSIEQLEQFALTHNPAVAQAAQRVNALRGEQLQVGLYPNPVIGYQVEEVGENGRAGQQGMFFSQELVTAGKLRLNRSVASQAVLQAEWSLQMQRQRVVNAVRARAYEMLAAQRTVDLAKELVQIGQEAVATADQLYQARQVSQIDVLQSRVEANAARLQLSAASKTHAAVWRQLAIVVGTPDMRPAPLTDTLDTDLPELSWPEVTTQILSQSPQLAHARAGVERARREVARQCAERTPNIQTGGSVRYNTDSNDTNFSLQIGVPLMIYDRNQGNILTAQADLVAAQRNVERIELLLQDQLADAFREYEVNRDQVEQYRRLILPDARQSLELTRVGYQQGELSYLELLTAQQTYSRTNLTYVDRLRDLWLAAVGIDGLLLTGALDLPEE